MALTPEQKKALTRLSMVTNEGGIGILKIIDGLETKVEGSIILIDEHLKSVRAELQRVAQYKIDLAKLKGDPGSPGKDGTDYVLTEQDKNEIATLAMMDIEVPVVEKIVERVEVIREQPIVTENVVEIAMKDTPQELIDKLKGVKEELSMLLETDSNNAKLSNDIIQRALGIVDQRTSFLINKVSNLSTRIDNLPAQSSGGGVSAWSTPVETPAADASVTVYTVGSVTPVEVNGDGTIYPQGTVWAFAGGKITFTNTNAAPTQFIRYR